MLFFSLILCSPVLNLPQEKAPQNKASVESYALKDLSWICGRWRGEMKGAVTEETWNEPMGDCMLGMFRAVKDGTVKFYEILVIEQDSSGPVLRMKHFSRNLVGWEDKEVSLDYPLARLQKDEAVFENPNTDRAKRIIYKKTAENELLIRLEREKDGQVVPDEFRFQRN